MATSSDVLDVAATIAGQLADTAIWHGERCNWVGAVDDEPDGAGTRIALRALGPELYDGTAGVALFLAEAATVLGDARLAATARGALGHALRHAAGTHGNGLHAGLLGIAYAAIRVATALRCELAMEGARDVLSTWSRARGVPTDWDVIGGCAGAASALVVLADAMTDPSLLEIGASVGDELIAAAERTSDGWFWPAPRRAWAYGLCGFSHGAAGAGHALAELWAVSGEVRFRDAALAAFDYERAWFRRRNGAWPDLREIDRRAGPDVPAPVSPTWCNGAPGIALSRLRAAPLLESDAVLADADAALALTRAHVAELGLYAPEEFSLCHGAAGAADVLLYGEDASGLAEQIGTIGIEYYHGPVARFPCAVAYGETPGLFTGLAGIGLFYLRLHDSNVPTVLVTHS